MHISRWDRIGAATGTAPFLAFVAGRVIDSTLTFPGENATTREIASFVQKNYDLINLGYSLSAVAAGLLIWFAGIVRAAIARTEDNNERLANIAFAGGALTGLLLLLFAGIDKAHAFHINSGDSNAESIWALESLLSGLVSVIPVSAAILMAAVGLAAVRLRSFPIWLGWISLILALANVVGTFLLAILPILPLLTFLWFFATSIVLIVRPQQAERSAAES